METSTDCRTETNAAQMKTARMETSTEISNGDEPVPSHLFQNLGKETCPEESVCLEDRRSKGSDSNGDGCSVGLSAEEKTTSTGSDLSEAGTATLHKNSSPSLSSDDNNELEWHRTVSTQTGEDLAVPTDMNSIDLDSIDLDLAWSAMKIFFLKSANDKAHAKCPGRTSAERQLRLYTKGLEFVLAMGCVLLFLSVYGISSQVISFLAVLVPSVCFMVDAYMLGKQFTSQGMMFWAYELTWLLVPVLYAICVRSVLSGQQHA